MRVTHHARAAERGGRLWAQQLLPCGMQFFLPIVRQCIKLSALERVYDDVFYAFGVETFDNGYCNPDDVIWHGGSVLLLPSV
jgi:hypothetical protein